MLAALERLASEYPASEDGETVLILRNTFSYAIRPANVKTFSGQALSALLGSSSDFTDTTANNIVLEATEGATASISLPETLFDGLNITSNETTIVYSIFLNEALFLRRQEYIEENNLTTNTPGGLVVGAFIPDNVTVTELDDPVQLTFLKNPVSSGALCYIKY